MEKKTRLTESDVDKIEQTLKKPLSPWPADAPPLIEGFKWRFLRSYFPFNDDLSEGEYAETLFLALQSLPSEEDREFLVDLLDSQYDLLSHQDLAIRRLFGEDEGTCFQERLGGYLEINKWARLKAGRKGLEIAKMLQESNVASDPDDTK